LTPLQWHALKTGYFAIAVFSPDTIRLDFNQTLSS